MFHRTEDEIIHIALPDNIKITHCQVDRQVVFNLYCNIHQYTMLCAPIMSQMAAIEAMKNGAKEVAAMKKEYNRRRNFIVTSLNEMGLTCHMPQGAFYAFPSIESTGMSSLDFAKDLLEKQKVALVPGTAFGQGYEGFVRISYASSYDNLREAVARIKKYLEEKRGSKKK